MKKTYAAAIALILVGFTLGVLFVANYSTWSIGNLFAAEDDQIGSTSAPAEPSEATKALNDAYVSVSNSVKSCVVSVSVIVETEYSNPYREQFREFFRFFGEPFNEEEEEEEERKHRGESSGSGVIISKDGYVITNYHVVENAEENGIKITTIDKKVYEAKLVGSDPLTDLAVLKIDKDFDVEPAHFAKMEDVNVGDIVFAVGNPLGLNYTVTSGIVSAIGRGQLNLLNRRSSYSVENFIQTDAAINPGNSGGGLFNIYGSLIGVNTAIATQTGAYIGYGFAIPANLVKAVALDLIEDGKVNRGYIGVYIRTVNEAMAKYAGLDKVEGVIVDDVKPGSAAEKAGVKAGDIIIEYGGKKVRTSNELQSRNVLQRAGDKVKLTIWRDGKKIYKTVVLQPKDEDDINVAEAQKGDEEDESSNAPVNFEDLGFSVKPLTRDIRENFGVDGGVYIAGVDRYGAATKQGLFPDGVIIAADGKPVSSTGALKAIVGSKSSGDVLLLKIKYSETNRFVAIEIP